ncbi:Glucose 1-dehydrogenase [Pseudolycoriella hygida]|uniref:Glucose 1-dehydrogenase n=1 Tax=Pseudolycoriella hygida TaxID=35572 RepID=A0A9Q0N685_9DIPT|nr:Glucose 1-dehydrogenase [Pseudolycoriella hygida]
MSLTGKVVLITGASSGIGADAARHLAKLGAKVSLVGRNQKRLNEVAEKIINDGSPTPLSIAADVTQESQRIVDETINHFGQLDVLINNAGIFISDSLDAFDINEYDRVMNINLRSVVCLTHLAVPHLEKTKGNIVNVSSDAGTLPYDVYLSYCISKAGINHFTKCAAVGLASKGIRVNAINPGDIRTPIFALAGVTDTEKYFEEATKNYLVGRVGEVSDTSAAIEYLVTQSFINGILLPVDGGLTCSGPKH